MPTTTPEGGLRLIRQELRRKPLLELMPYLHTLLFDWRCDVVAADGTRVSCFVNAWTRRPLLLSADGRRYRRRDGIAVPYDGPDDLPQLLPNQDDWLQLGGYAPGDLLGEPIRAEDLAF